ncbi:MAG: hypothetical protein ACYTGG_05855 [Planctomycetota bacterium]|jgi:hypothetical protein
MLSKLQLIAQIQNINQSATTDWLDHFDVSALKRYLDHLQKTLEPRGRHSTWIRQGDTPAVVTRRPAA